MTEVEASPKQQIADAAARYATSLIRRSLGKCERAACGAEIVRGLCPYCAPGAQEQLEAHVAWMNNAAPTYRRRVRKARRSAR